MNLTYLVPPICFFIALVFSMLGMGGSQLYIPVLFWLGMDFTAAAALLMLSGWKPAGGSLSPKGKVILGVTGGTILGFFAGLIGRGGGSFVVPLLFIAGLAPKIAIATSSLIITFAGTSSFLSHIFTAAHPNWPVWILSVAAVFLGGQAGSRIMAGWLRPRAIKIIFGVVLLGVAALLIIKDVF